MSDDPARQLTADLSGEVAIVTGASRGIGRAVACRLAVAGATTICVARNAATLGQTVESIRAAGGTADCLECDVADTQSVHRVVQTVLEKWPELTILVNNAGIARDALLARMSDEQWDEVHRTNLRGTFLFTRAVTKPMMQRRYGRIINVASISGQVGNPGQANYAASKAGIVGFTKSVARELASRNITCNAVAPGFIETDMTEALSPLVRDELPKHIPCKRLGTPQEIASGVLFLASRAAAYVNGQVLTIDGGMTA